MLREIGTAATDKKRLEEGFKSAPVPPSASHACSFVLCLFSMDSTMEKELRVKIGATFSGRR